jgi:small subunit ribosomal protein S19e
MSKALAVDANKLIENLSKELKNHKEISPPQWASFAKTGAHKERPPMRDDWWYARAASVLRSISMRGPIGVSKLRTKYGGRKNKGHQPEKFYRGSGSITRKILQQLESAKLLKKAEKGAHKGRVVTAEGKKLLNRVADGAL